MTLPTRQEINPLNDDLDGQAACEHFFGKSLDEAEAMFRERDLYYQEDLMWMGAPAFRYYVPAALQYVRRSTGDVSEFVSWLVSTLEHRLEWDREELAPVASQLAEFCGYVIEHWSRFSEGAEFYGDVPARCESLRGAFSQLNQKAV
jgi:hypothetical protein